MRPTNNERNFISATSNVSWGCVQVDSKDECMRQVHQGRADIVSLNATEMFIAGQRYNLVPFIGEDNKGLVTKRKLMLFGY